MENNWRFYDEKSERYADNNGRLGSKEKTTHSVPAIEQVRNEICPCGQVKSLRGEIFALQM